MFKTDRNRTTKLQKRIQKMSTPDLTLWAEQALYGIGRCLTSWQRTQSKDDLEELYNGAEAFFEVVSEMRTRARNE